VSEVDGRSLFGVRPDCAVGEVRGKLEREGLVEMREMTLEEPGLFGEIYTAKLYVRESCNSREFKGEEHDPFG
jgi:hypothetical protein